MSFLNSAGLFDAIPDSGVARWTFDDADTESGTTLDVWGDNDGNITGATTGVSGANQTYTTNEAYDFDGADDYVTAPLPLSGSVDVSLAFWINVDAYSSSTHGLVHMGTGDTNNESAYGIIINQDEYVIAGYGGEYDFDTGITASTGTWVHLVATYDSSTDDVTFYIDGSSQASGTLGFTINSNGILI